MPTPSTGDQPMRSSHRREVPHLVAFAAVGRVRGARLALICELVEMERLATQPKPGDVQ